MLTKMFLFVSACISCIMSWTYASSTTYRLDDNIHLTSDVPKLNDRPAMSSRYCAQLCTTDPSCVAANFDANSAICELLASHAVWPIHKTGSTGLLPQFKVPGRLDINYNSAIRHL